MEYFVSYVEIQGHASLIISTRAPGQLTPQVISQTGFAPAPWVGQSQVAPWKGPVHGHLREEDRLGIIRYGRGNGYHKTYRISKAEMEALLIDINQNRQINIDEQFALQTGKVEAASGPNYHLLIHNCKRDAVMRLKRIGIIGIDSVENFWVQAPNISNSGMQPIDSSAIEYPERDSLIEDITTFLDKVDEIETVEDGTEFGAIAESLRRDLGLIGKNEEVDNKAKLLLEHYRERYPDMIAAINFDDRVSKLKENESRFNHNYRWKEMPKVTERINLENFSEQEKMIYGTEAYVSDALEELSRVYQIIEQQKHSSKLSSYKKDCDEIQRMIIKAKRDINNAALKYRADYDTSNNEQAQLACAMLESTVTKKLDSLRHNISEFKPKDEKMNAAVRLIHSILTFLHIMRDHSVKPFIRSLDKKIKVPMRKNELRFGKLRKGVSLLARLKHFLNNIFTTINHDILAQALSRHNIKLEKTIKNKRRDSKTLDATTHNKNKNRRNK